MPKPNQTVTIAIRGTSYYDAATQFSSGKLRPSAKLILQRELDNPYDEYAVHIKLASSGAILGHISKDLSERYSSLVDSGAIVKAHIRKAYRRESGHLTIECIIEYADNAAQPTANSEYLWHRTTERVSGVYEIRNLKNGCCYIGSAIDAKDRALTHERDLVRSVHHNSALQSSFNKLSSRGFSFKVVSVCPPNSIRTEEAKELAIRLAKNQPLYNVTDDGQGISPADRLGVQPRQTHPSYVQPRLTQPSQVQPRQIPTSQVQPNQAPPSQVQPHQTPQNLVQPHKTSPSQVQPNLTQPTQVQPHQAKRRKAQAVYVSKANRSNRSKKTAIGCAIFVALIFIGTGGLAATFRWFNDG